GRLEVTAGRGVSGGITVVGGLPGPRGAVRRARPVQLARARRRGRSGGPSGGTWHLVLPAVPSRGPGRGRPPHPPLRGGVVLGLGAAPTRPEFRSVTCGPGSARGFANGRAQLAVRRPLAG